MTTDGVATTGELDAAAANEATVSQLNTINETIAQTQPLVAQQGDILTLQKEYEDNIKPGFVKGIIDLAQRYRAFRRVRGDGNCFYRSFLFALLEHLVATLGVSEAAATAEIDRLTGVITNSKDALISVGYQEIVFDSFQEALLEMLASLKGKTLAELEQEFQVEDGISIHLVWFCRLLTAAYLKMHADRCLRRRSPYNNNSIALALLYYSKASAPLIGFHVCVDDN
eukprot:6348-Heterococcus_DN1.PRE.1